MSLRFSVLQSYPTDDGVEDTTVGGKNTNLDERVEERHVKDYYSKKSCFILTRVKLGFSSN